MVDGHVAKNIPFEMIWADIEYMDGDYKDFTVNKERYPSFNEFAEKLHKENMKLAVIVDPGITKEDGYKYWEDGKKLDIFVKSVTNKDKYNSILIGSVWP